MAEYRVEFPDGESWKIDVKGKTGGDALVAAYTRANQARVLAGKEPADFDACTVQKMTSRLRSELKGIAYLSPADLLQACRRIGSEYIKQGLALTLRGMYYQLVSRGLIPSGKKEYDRVKSVLSDARMRGEFPLDLLSDSSRTLHVGASTRYDFDVDAAITQAEDWIPKLGDFFLAAARWYRQPVLPIVLFEKEALSNVFGPTCNTLGVSWMAVKGYPSMSTLFELHELMRRSMEPGIQDCSLAELGYDDLAELDPDKDRIDVINGHHNAVEALNDEVETSWAQENPETGEDAVEHDHAEEFRYRYGGLVAKENHQGTARQIRILYFGDHDPEGLEIPEDVEYRLRVIQIRRGEVIPFTVERLGLNRDQIEKYAPPPFWAKETSARYATYVDSNPWVQDRAWELDSLDPVVLRDLVKTAVNACFDDSISDDVKVALRSRRDEFDSRMKADVIPKLFP